MASREFRGALDFDVGMYSNLHAGLVANRGRDELSQAIVTIFLGNLIVVVPMILNAHRCSDRSAEL